jgi:tetratricopeptide (TPR) repeat protein
LPGFIRAYGDPELFQRFRWRFLLAPPIVFACALWFASADLHGLLLLVFTWDIWHVLMQHYGFMRIYDAKMGRTGTRDALLDRTVSIAWYVTLIALSPYYTHNLLFRAYSGGTPAIPLSVLSAIRVGLLAASAIAALLYFAFNFKRPNWPKLALLAAFVFATWYLYIRLDDFQVGFAVWSAFHCIQYYGIVWAFNRNRMAKPGLRAAFGRFLFRPRWWLVAIYLALIFAYGGINYAAQLLSPGKFQQLLMAFVVTSGTLHYYFDGFIWKVREPATRRSLEIETKTRTPPVRGRSGSVIPVASLAAALALLCLLEVRRPVDEVSLRHQLVLAVPEAGEARLNLADALRRRGRLEEAASAYGEAIRLSPRSSEARSSLGITLAEMGRGDDAIAEFERALALDPGANTAHYNLASLLVRKGDARGAVEHFRRAFPEGDEHALRAIGRDPNAAEVLNNFGLGLLQTGERKAGLRMFRLAVAANPRHAPAQLNLASALVLEGNIAEAGAHYQEAIRAGDEPLRASARRALAALSQWSSGGVAQSSQQLSNER